VLCCLLTAIRVTLSSALLKSSKILAIFFLTSKIFFFDFTHTNNYLFGILV
jgi:hypothetical protein